MMWSHRPRFHHLGLFIAAYVLGCGFAHLLGVIPGTLISIWLPSGLFIATLVLAPGPSWPWWILAGCIAELFSNFLWFHSPLMAGLLIYIGNALEAMTGAWLIRRTCRRPIQLDTVPEVLALVISGAGIAPVVSATIGSATLAWFGILSQNFTTAWPLWWIGDATGVLIVAPLALVVFQNWRGKVDLSAARWKEACLLGLIFLGVAILSLSGYLPFAYIIMPPLLWAAVRFEFKGAAATMIILALVTAIFATTGASQFAGDPAAETQKQIMLQLFLAISACSALIVAAISRQYQLAIHTSRENEQKLQQMIDAVPVRIWSMAPEGGRVTFNKRYQDHLRSVLANPGDLQDPHIGKLLQQLVHPEDAPAVERAMRNGFETGSGCTMRFRWRESDGIYRWAECRMEPWRDEAGAIAQWYGVSLDIDEEVRAREALRSRERELSLLVDMVPSYLWRMTPEGEPNFFNKRLVEFFGMDIDGADQPAAGRLPALIEQVVHPDDQAGLRESLGNSLATGESFSRRYRLRRADGVYRWVAGLAEPFRGEDGRILQWYGLTHDIDDLVTTQEALRDQRHELSLLVDMIPSHLWRMTPDGRTTLINKHMADFMAADKGDMTHVDTVLATTFHPDEVDAVWEHFNHCVSTGEIFSMQYRLRRADGVYRWMSGRAEPMRDENGNILQWFGLCHDIDEQVRAEEALRRASDRLAQATQAASLAELSASIAHEVNQPLAAIVANSHACHRWLSAEPPNVERAKITAERITRDANSAADVVTRIRALFRHTTEARSPEDVNRLIGEVCQLMADKTAAKDVRVETKLDPDLPPVALDRVQVQQVFVNLIRNGIEAMEHMVDGARALQISTARDGNESIRIEVRDAGTGFTDAERVLQPFFTTKPNGMGMGLAICRSIVESHGGRLWTANNEPRGATVAFTLPLTASEAA
jgi:PAS domain S-box-containing protein